MENNFLIETKDLVKEYPIGGGKFTALDKVSLNFAQGEFTGLVGPSGSGKTTLLNVIGALDNPTHGQVIVMGENTGKLKHKEAAQLRNNSIGFIFQTFNLLPVYSVFENVEFPLLLQNKSASERKKAVEEALEWVGLSDKLKSRPAQLSGGESQRVAVARAMVKKPSILLADEPTANLDSDNSINILETMCELNKELGTTFIFATHDQKVINYLSRIITLTDGKVVGDDEIKNPVGKEA